MKREYALNKIAEAMNPGETIEIRCTSYWQGINSIPDGYDVYEVSSEGWEYVRHERHERGMGPNFAETYSKMCK